MEGHMTYLGTSPAQQKAPHLPFADLSGARVTLAQLEKADSLSDAVVPAATF